MYREKCDGLVPLMRPHDLGVHSREVEINVVLLLVGVSLEKMLDVVVKRKGRGAYWCVHALS